MNPIVSDKIKIHTLKYNFDLDIKNNLILIIGKSASGKSYMYDSIEKTFGYKDDTYVCINHKTDRSKLASKYSGKIIVIDNADIVLNDEDRYNIAMDKENQYIILCHCIDGFMTGPTSLAELYLDDDVFRLDYFML